MFVAPPVRLPTVGTTKMSKPWEQTPTVVARTDRTVKTDASVVINEMQELVIKQPTAHFRPQTAISVKGRTYGDFNHSPKHGRPETYDILNQADPKGKTAFPKGPNIYTTIFTPKENLWQTWQYGGRDRGAGGGKNRQFLDYHHLLGNYWTTWTLPKNYIDPAKPSATKTTKGWEVTKAHADATEYGKHEQRWTPKGRVGNKCQFPKALFLDLATAAIVEGSAFDAEVCFKNLRDDVIKHRRVMLHGPELPEIYSPNGYAFVMPQADYIVDTRSKECWVVGVNLLSTDDARYGQAHFSYPLNQPTVMDSDTDNRSTLAFKAIAGHEYCLCTPPNPLPVLVEYEDQNDNCLYLEQYAN